MSNSSDGWCISHCAKKGEPRESVVSPGAATPDPRVCAACYSRWKLLRNNNISGAPRHAGEPRFQLRPRRLSRAPEDARNARGQGLLEDGARTFGPEVQETWVFRRSRE